MVLDSQDHGHQSYLLGFNLQMKEDKFWRKVLKQQLEKHGLADLSSLFI
jgi:hypothetical protein